MRNAQKRALRTALLPCSIATLAVASWALGNSLGKPVGTLPPVTAALQEPPISAAGNPDLFTVLGDPTSLWARVRPDLKAKKVTFDWTYLQAGDVKASLKQEVAVAYWPTQVFRYGGDLLLVAGKSRTGTTVVELWKVTNASPISGDYGAGTTWTILPATVDWVETVLSQQGSGTDTVIGMQRALGPGHGALLYFDDSKDVYSLDLTQQFDGTEDPVFPLSKIASSTPSSTVPYVPELADPYRDLFFSQHNAAHGYVYFLGYFQANGDTILLIDGDKNGTVDSTLLTNYGQRVAMGLTDPALSLDPRL